MRLLLVSNTYPPRDISGVGALVSELAGEAARQGHEVGVLTRRQPAAGPPVSPVAGPKLLFPLTAALAFLRRFAGHVPDVVHVHESDGALVVLAARLARLFGHPLGRAVLVATLQVSYVEERRSVRVVRDGEHPLSRPTGGERLFAWVRAPILALLGRATAALVDSVVAPSRATAEELERDYGCRVAAVVPNGVLPLPVSTPDAARRPDVLYAGRLRTRKAVAVLLQAFARLAPRRPEARLIVVGSGEQAAALTKQCEQLGLGDRVLFTGGLSRDELAPHYARAAVFCLPSIYEGFPVAILEAMAAGLPVVATRVAGIPEAVVEGETGFVVPPEDATALAERLDQLLGDDELRARMGRAGRERFEREYAIARVAARHLDLFAELVGARSAKTQGRSTQ